MSRLMSVCVFTWIVHCAGVLSSDAHAQGIPAVSGALKHKVSETVLEGTPATLTLTVADRPAAFYAKCTFGSPAKSVEAESEALDAGKPFVIALPADTTARSADCAVVARFANGLSERKPVKMSWEVVPVPKEGDPATDADAPGEQAPSGTPSRSTDAPSTDDKAPAKDPPAAKDAPTESSAPPEEDDGSTPTP